MENRTYYGEIRVRNSGAGRVKPIRFRNPDENDPWGVNKVLRSAKDNIIHYIKEYQISYYGQDLIVKKGVYKGWGQVYIQGFVKDSDKYLPNNFFKTPAELEDYLMKYYFAYRFEQDIYYWMKYYKDHPRDTGSLYQSLLDKRKQRYFILHKASVIDIVGEFPKYYETGKSDLPKVLYENYLKWKEDPMWIRNAIKQSKDANIMQNFFGLLNFADSFGGPFLRNGFYNMMQE